MACTASEDHRVIQGEARTGSGSDLPADSVQIVAGTEAVASCHLLSESVEHLSDGQAC